MAKIELTPEDKALGPRMEASRRRQSLSWTRAVPPSEGFMKGLRARDLVPVSSQIPRCATLLLTNMLYCRSASQNLFSGYLRALVSHVVLHLSCFGCVLVQCREAYTTLGLGALLAQTQYFGLCAVCQEDLR